MNKIITFNQQIVCMCDGIKTVFLSGLLYKTFGIKRVTAFSQRFFNA
jgi:hypothetical protein